MTALFEDVPLFDIDAGRALRDEGMEAVDAATTAAHKTWKPKAQGALRQLIARGREFTADDLHKIVGQKPDHPNQVGPLFREAAQRGEIKYLRHQQSKSRSRRASQLAVWIAA